MPTIQNKPNGDLVIRTSITLKADKDASIIDAIKLAMESGVRVATIIRALMKSGTDNQLAEEVQVEDEIGLADLGEEI